MEDETFFFFPLFFFLQIIPRELKSGFGREEEEEEERAAWGDGRYQSDKALICRNLMEIKGGDETRRGRLSRVDTPLPVKPRLSGRSARIVSQNSSPDFMVGHNSWRGFKTDLL